MDRVQDPVSGMGVLFGQEQPAVAGAQAAINHANRVFILKAASGFERVTEMDQKVAAKADAIFEKTKALIVEHLTSAGIAEFQAYEIKVQINYGTQIASWAGPDGIIHQLSLAKDNRTLENGDEIRAQMQEFVSATSMHTRSHHLNNYESGISGCADRTFFSQGVSGLGATFGDFVGKDLKKLMKKVAPGSENDDTEVNKKMKGMVAVDLYKKALTTKLKAMIGEQKNLIVTAQEGGEDTKQLKADLRLLQKKLQDVEGVHNEALYAYLAIQDENGGKSADEIERHMRGYLVDDKGIDHKREGWQMKSVLRLKEPNDRFIKGVGALAIQADGNDGQHRLDFNKYAEAKHLGAGYGTGLEGSFFLTKANDVRDRSQDELITGGFKNQQLGNRLSECIDATERRVGDLHREMREVWLDDNVDSGDEYLKKVKGIPGVKTLLG